MGEGGGVPAGDGPPVPVVALDLPDAEAARALVGRLPAGTWYKVGLELFTAEGPDLVRELAGAGHPLFLDLKLHDIPHTVERAVRAAGRLGVRLLTVHAAGGREMLAAAARAAEEVPPGPAGRLELLAVTVLTSLDDALLADVMGEGARVEEAVGRLAALARGSGVHGAVASVAECRAVKAVCGPEFRVATPGIRFEGGEAGDQKRVATPVAAAAAGADYLVVGRAVRESEDPAAALERVRREAAPG